MDWTPIITALVGGAFSWFVRAKLSEYQKLKEELREKRSGVYANMLEPYIKIFSGLNADNKDSLQEAMAQVTSYEYRETAFRFTLLGSDSVVRAYNNLMQHIYNLESSEDPSQEESMKTIHLLGKLLLEIRRSLGNRGTTLSKTEMLKWLIKDIKEPQED